MQGRSLTQGYNIANVMISLTLCLFESAAPTLSPALRALPLCFPIF